MSENVKDNERSNGYVFNFYNELLGEEYDEYQEETMNIDGLIKCYMKNGK